MTDEQAILTPERVATVAAILHPAHDPAGLPLQHGGDLQSARTRKRRSDAGVKKGPKVAAAVFTDLVEVHLPVDDANRLCRVLLEHEENGLAQAVQEGIIAHYRSIIRDQQRRIDALQRQKEAK